MALVKCPECGRENVSNTAQCCPECGFGIHDYFIQQRNKQIAEEKAVSAAQKAKVQKEKEAKELERRLANIKSPEEPQKGVCKIRSDSFQAVVNYWGDSTTHYEEIELLNENGRKIGVREIDSSGTYDFYMQWNDIKGTVSLYVSSVSSESTSVHRCEVCSDAGWHKYNSFTGQTEYYCDKHYKELMALFDALSNP